MLHNFAQFKNIGHWLEYWAEHAPDKVAFHFLGEKDGDVSSISFSELLDRTQAVASALLQSAHPGDRVVLTYHPGIEFFVAFLGCIQAGLIAVPVYPPTSAKHWPRFIKIVLNCAAQVICTTHNLAQQSHAGIATSPLLSQVKILETDGLSTPGQDYVECTASRDSIAFLQYTSGSTGDPKGVILTHGNVYHNECLITEAMECDADSVAVCWLPQYHDMGLIGNLLGSLFNGVTAVLMSPLSFLKSPYRWLKAISDFQATHSGGPNFAYELCVERISEQRLASLDLSHWRRAYPRQHPGTLS